MNRNNGQLWHRGVSRSGINPLPIVFQVGDLVRYMSRVVLIVDTDIDGPWVYGIELGEIEVAKYKRHALRELV